jgi:hypothetical protein
VRHCRSGCFTCAPITGRLLYAVQRCATIVSVATRKLTAFRIDEDLLEGLRLVYERDGILPSEQVRRAIRAWLEARGVAPKKSARKRVQPRSRA